MKALINTYAFRQTSIDSANLGVLGVVAHPISNDGEFEGSVFQNAVQAKTFHLTVSEQMKNKQADVDLFTLVAQCQRQRTRYEEPSYSMAENGYVVFFVSQGPGGFHVLLKEQRKQKSRRVFDSRKLQKGDFFIVSLLRPGIYEMAEKYAKAEGKITIAYPKIEKQPYVPKPPETVIVSEAGFKPSNLKLGAAQGVIFTIETSKAAVKVNLKEPSNGPGRKKGQTRDKVRWRNPSPIK